MTLATRGEAEATEPAPAAANRATRNIIRILSDQEQSALLPAEGDALPARRRIAERGIRFRSHDVAAAMCSPSRAALLTGLPPQRKGVFDQREHPYVPNLPPTLPHMGSVPKGLGYATA